MHNRGVQKDWGYVIIKNDRMDRFGIYFLPFKVKCAKSAKSMVALTRGLMPLHNSMYGHLINMCNRIEFLLTCESRNTQVLPPF